MSLEEVRILIPDTDAIYGTAGDEYLFSDAQISAVLAGTGKGSVLRTAGLLMIAVGNSEAMISKIIRTQDLQTNGAQLQNSWRESGQAFLDQADKEDAITAGEFFEIVDYGSGWDSDWPELTEGVIP